MTLSIVYLIQMLIFQSTYSGCFSYVGRITGAQALNLEPDPFDHGCFRRGSIIHEFLHALGFQHMQSSSNRDDYIMIIWENIRSTAYGNFEIIPNTGSFGQPYDYDSILHYHARAFSINGEYTIIPIDSEVIKIY